MTSVAFTLTRVLTLLVSVDTDTHEQRVNRLRTHEMSCEFVPTSASFLILSRLAHRTGARPEPRSCGSRSYLQRTLSIDIAAGLRSDLSLPKFAVISTWRSLILRC